MAHPDPKLPLESPTGPVLVHPRRPSRSILLISMLKSPWHQTLRAAAGPRTEPPIGFRPFIPILMNDLRLRLMRKC
jgi:hypothetical protein